MKGDHAIIRSKHPLNQHIIHVFKSTSDRIIDTITIDAELSPELAFEKSELIKTVCAAEFRYEENDGFCIFKLCLN